jgi:hypothetical protein
MPLRVECSGANGLAPGEVVLRFGDASVHASNINAQSDGSLSGVISGIFPRGIPTLPQLSAGDRIKFQRTHVFTFTALPESPPSLAWRRQAPSHRQHKVTRPAADASLTSRRRRRREYGLIATAAAVLCLGITMSYSMGSSPAHQRESQGQVFALKLDYDVVARQR